MAINITMPALSPTMEEGTLSKWLIKPGDAVSSGDIIAEIETDKATMEVEAGDEGTLAKILVEAGTEGVKVNSVIAVLAEEGEDAGSVEAADIPSETAKKVSKAEGPPEPEKKDTKPSGNGSSEPIKLQTVDGADGRLKASPLARRIAALKNVDLKSLTGSGPHGRIIRKDVDAAVGKSSASKPNLNLLVHQTV